MECRSSMGESVIVVMDANRTKGSVDALSWALNHVVRPRDTVVVLGVLCEFGKKTSCFPFHMGVGISAIWERIEFSVQGDMTPQVLEEEIAKKREQYQSTLQPFYQQCKKNKVKLEVKLAAGFDPKKITIEEAHSSNTRWIVLDSHLKRDKAFIQEHVGCNIASMKRKNVATITMSRTTECKGLCTKSMHSGDEDALATQPDKPPSEDLNFPREQNSTASPPSRPCCYPLSWRTGFPRIFDYSEVESITNGFASEYIVSEDQNLKVYQGFLTETPVLLKCFSSTDECFWSELKILSKVRHRYSSNLLGFCCTDAYMFLLQDYSCNGTLDMHLQCDQLAMELSWKVRLDIALKIGSCLRYLHEECHDGPIAHLSVRSSHILFSHGCSVMLTDFTSARCLKGNNACDGDIQMEGPTVCPTMGLVQYLSLDVHAYGLLLLELITGKTTLSIHNCRDGLTLLDWALPLLENDSLSQVIDPRLMDSGDTKDVQNMATAALLCLKNDSGNLLSTSEVVAVLQKR